MKQEKDLERERRHKEKLEKSKKKATAIYQGVMSKLLDNCNIKMYIEFYMFSQTVHILFLILI